MAGANLNDEANGTRLSRLLVNKGTEALRQTFDKYHPPSTLQTILNTHLPSLQNLQKRKIINNDQWKLLYPTSGNPHSKNFDITLLSVLLRDICGLKPPATGWSTMPPDTDRSLAANQVRIKLYRNKIFAHVTTTGVSDSQLADLWPKISQTLNDLGISKTETDKLKICPLSPEEENYIEVLKDWKLQDDKLHEVLDEIKFSATKILKISDEIKESIPESTRELQKSLAVQTKEIEAIVKKQSESSSQPDADENLLIHKLCKFNFDGDIKNSVRSFHPGTREWLFAEVEDWFSKKKSNVFVLTAGPGVGKSVLAAKIICAYREEKKSLAAYHFCKFNNSNYRNPLKMIQSLASQLCDSVEGFKPKLLEQLKRPNEVQNLQDAFQVYLKEPLQQQRENKQMLVVIDGLDECDSDEKTELLDVLANEFSKLPSWLKVFVTTRPEISVKKKLTSLAYKEILPTDGNNEEDMKQYLTSHLPTLSERRIIISCLTKKCEGSFLFAFYLQKHLQNCRSTITKKEITSLLPGEISSVYQDYFARLKKELEAVSKEYDMFHLLAIIAVAHGPIPLSFITEGLDRTTMKDIIGKVNENVSTLLYVNNDLVTVFHKSVVDWLKLTGDKEHNYTVNCERGNELLWKLSKEKLEEIKKNIVNKNDRSIIDELKRSKAMKYALENGINHLSPAPSNWSKSVDYEWLVDVVILHVVFIDNSATFKKLWKTFIEIKTASDYDTSMARIKEKISWHYNHFSSLKVVPIYVQDILNEGPSKIFSDEEKGIAKDILNNHLYFWCEKLDPLHLTPNIHVTACAFSPDGLRLVSCASDGRIHIWNIDSFVVVQELSDDCKQAICCFWSDEILIFHQIGSVLMLSKYPVNEASNVEVKKVTLGTDKATPLAFSPKACIYRCSNDSTIKFYRFAETNEISIPELKTMDKFAVSRDGSSILAADKDHFEIWKMNGDTSTKCHLAISEKFPLYCGKINILHCSISSDEELGIISCSCSTKKYDPYIIFLIDIKSGNTIAIKPRHPTGEVLHAEIIDETFLCLQSEKRITVYHREYSRGTLTHFNHNAYLDYYKVGSICRSGNIIALPQESGGICLVKLHLPKPNWENFESRIVSLYVE